MTLNEDKKRRYVAAIIESCCVQGPLNDEDVYDALCDVLVHERLPRPDLARWYELEEPYARFDCSQLPLTPGPVAQP